MSAKRVGVYSFCAFLMLALVLLPSTMSLADEGVKQRGGYEGESESLLAAEEIQEEMDHEIEAYVRYMPSSDAKNQSGEVEIINSGFGYTYGFTAFGKVPMKFLIDKQYISIENSTGLKLPAHLVSLSTGLEATFPFFGVDKTYLRVGVYPGFHGDDWSFPSSSFRIPSRVFAIYKPNDKWIFILGVAALPDYETEAFPILGLIYKPNEKFTLDLMPLRPMASYALNDKVTLFAEGAWIAGGGEFEVDKGYQKNVVLKYRETRLGAGVKYKFNKYIESSISAGGAFDRSLKYRNRNLGKVRIESGPYMEFRVDIKI